MANGNYTVGGIAYDKENDRLVTKQTTTCVSILDNAYKGIKDIEIYASSLTGQGIGFFNNYIYLPYAELAHELEYQPTYYNTAEICSALIYIYDLEGNFIKTLYIPGKNIEYGEIESISFDENGVMYIGVYGKYYNDTNKKQSAINFYTVNQYTNADTGNLIDFKPNTDSISVKNQPIKTTYTVGEDLDLSGGNITVEYKERIVTWDNDLNRTVTDPKVITKTIDIGAKGVSVTGYDKNRVGTQTITVKYDGKETTFDVTVNPKIEVTFEKNDGTSETWNQTFVYGDSGNKFGYKNGEIWPGYTYKENEFLGWRRTGYTLLGWSNNPNAITPEFNIYSDISDDWIMENAPLITLYAVWKEKTAILSYNANEHGTAPSQVIMKYTEETNAASAITATGYTFEGWNTNADGSGTQFEANSQVKGSNVVPKATVLYAQWTANEVNFENQTITKIFSKNERIITVKEATNGTGEYTYTKKSGDSDIKVSAEGKITIPANKNAGTYIIVLTATDSISNSTKDATYTIIIKKATPKVKVNLIGTTKWGETITAEASNTGNGTLYEYQWYYLTSSEEGSVTNIDGATSSTYTVDKENVGKYIGCKVTVAETDNYKAKEELTEEVKEIEKQDLTVTRTNYSGIYDGKEHGITVKVSSTDWDGKEIVSGINTNYEQSVTEEGTTNIEYTLKPTFIDATNLETVYYKIVGGTYFNDYTGTGTITITKANSTITLSEISAEVDYNQTGSFIAKPSVEGTLTAKSENTEQVNITEGTSTVAKANTGYTITYTGTGYTTNATTITISLEPTDSKNYNNSTATFSVTKVNKIDMEKPIVSIDTEGKITWATITGATSYEISFDNNKWESATSGSKTIDISTAGNKTAYVRALTTNKNYNTPSEVGSKEIAVYNLTINKGTGISKVTGEGNYIEGKEIQIEAVAETGYTWLKWSKTKGIEPADITSNKTNLKITEDTILIAEATANELIFEDTTVTKTFSTKEQVINVKPATNGTGEYTYTKKSGDSDIKVSAEGKITIPANKNAGTYITVITSTDSISNSIKDATYTININKATPTITLSEISAEVDYNQTGSFIAKPSVEGTLTAKSENTEQVNITEGTSTVAKANTGYTITYTGTGYTTNATTITISLEPTDSKNYNNSTATFSVTKVNKIDMEKPIVSIDTEGKITWATITGATSYEISFDNNKWESATSGSKTIDISTAGNKTAYVRALTTNKNYNTPSEVGSKEIAVYNLTINKGTGISKVTGEGNYIEGKEIQIEAVAETGYTWLKWSKTKGIEPADITSNKTNLKITEDTILTAEATANELIFTDKTITKIFSKSEQIDKNAINEASNGTEHYLYNIIKGNNEGYFSINGKDLKIKGNTKENTYKLTIEAEDINSKKTKTAIYTIIITKAIEINEYVIENNILKNANPETTVANFKKNIMPGNLVNIRIVNKENIELKETEIIKTGDKLQVIVNDEITEYPIAIKGDVNGDGYADIKDILSINKHRLNKTKLENIYFIAGDIDENGNADIRDILQINKYRLKKINTL